MAERIVILHNRAKCRRCKSIIESKHRHDYKRCQCGAIFVDGGKDYRRYGFRSPEDFEDLMETKVVLE